MSVQVLQGSGQFLTASDSPNFSFQTMEIDYNSIAFQLTIMFLLPLIFLASVIFLTVRYLD